MSFGVLSLRGSVNLDMGGSFRVADRHSDKHRDDHREHRHAQQRHRAHDEVPEPGLRRRLQQSRQSDVLHRTVSGRVFHSIHGFVDISTSVALRFPTPDTGVSEQRRVLLTGPAANRRIRVTANSATLVTLALDLDGNGAFERERVSLDGPHRTRGRRISATPTAMACTTAGRPCVRAQSQRPMRRRQSTATASAICGVQGGGGNPNVADATLRRGAPSPAASDRPGR